MRIMYVVYRKIIGLDSVITLMYEGKICLVTRRKEFLRI